MLPEIIDGIIINPEQNSYKIYLYDPYRMSFMSEGSTGDSAVIKMDLNATLTPVGDYDITTQIPIFDPKNDEWYFIATECHLLDKDGFYIETAQNPLLNTEEDPLPLNTEIKPPVDLNDPWFDTELQGWVSKPKPKNLKKPIFRNKNWEESATFEEFVELLKNERNIRLSILDKPLLIETLSVENKQALIDDYYWPVRRIDENVSEQDISKPWDEIFPSKPEFIP